MKFPVKPGEEHSAVLSSLNLHFRSTYSKIQSKNIWVRVWWTSHLCNRAQYLLSALPMWQMTSPIPHFTVAVKWLSSCVIHTDTHTKSHSEHMVFLAYVHERALSPSSIQCGETEINEWVCSQVRKAARFGPVPRVKQGKFLRALRGSNSSSDIPLAACTM